jgi:hypothetical protein
VSSRLDQTAPACGPEKEEVAALKKFLNLDLGLECVIRSGTEDGKHK